MNTHLSFYKALHKLSDKNLDASYLLAVSGGMDSMVLLHLFTSLELNFEVAHVNYMLRGEESDMDETFLKQHCAEIGALLHIHKEDTKSFCAAHNFSIQEGARNIRYAFFDKICREKKIQFIVTAHHQQDNVETFFINLLRGSGISGLTGIPEQNNNILRPLLGVSKHEIKNYADINEIPYRDDSSNISTKYLRNAIRHDILPKMEILNDHAIASIANSMNWLKQGWQFISEQLIHWKNSNLESLGHLIYIRNFKKTDHYLMRLFLLEVGCNNDQITKIFSAETGSYFVTDLIKIHIDRDDLILEKEIEKPKSYTVEILPFYAKEIQLKISINEHIDLSGGPKKLALDFEKIKFPIIIRHWEEGDSFTPLGMKGKKKISDYLIDNKVPNALKKEIYVIESNSKIAGIIGHRIADWAKITKKSKKSLEIETFG